MLFNSIDFFIFFTIVLALYWSIGYTWQNRMLLVASYIFYGWWDWRFLGLLAGTTLVDFWVGLVLSHTEESRRRRMILLLSIVANLGVLSFFKYFGFFTDSFADVVQTLGFDWHPDVWTIILPVGISFYTFQSMSYTIDVYRKRLTPTSSLVDFALFVAFFPQLVAGPIERATHLLPQIIGPRTRPDSDAIQRGIGLILGGLLRKVVIADLLAPLVERNFSLADRSSYLSLIVAAVAFGLQIYGDFAGYSGIARGVAKLMGFDLMHNFRQPYLARNITEFWRRWHISLSTWLRDYLYIPLGGNRGGKERTYINLMLVMLLGGLWHGAAWTFVVWGGIHGLALVAHRMFRSETDEIERPVNLSQLPSMLLTFATVTIAWVFFRSDSLADALNFIEGIVTRRGGFFTMMDAATVAVLASLAFTLDICERWMHQSALVGVRQLAFGVGAGLGLAGILVASGSQVIPFIYFQF